MEINELHDRLVQSKIFKDWKKDNDNDYLVNFFKFFESGTKAPWQLGYYNQKTDLMTTFVMDDDININPASKVFKKEDTIEELNLLEVKEDYENALKFASDYQKKNYRTENPVKIIILLQRKKGNEHYNITYITQNLKTLNMKISAKEKDKIIEAKITNLMDFKQDNK